METKHAKVVVIMLTLAMTALLSLGSHAAAPPTGDTFEDEIALLADDPRTAISAVPHTISNSGSYYLTKDMQTSSGSANAIHINADSVTLDLMGFSLIGRGSGTGKGIRISGQTNVEIRNGTVRDFGGEGIHEDSADNGMGHRVIGIRAISNGSDGIHLSGGNHLVRNCVAYSNIGTGVFVGLLSSVRDSVCTGNLGHGIELSAECTASANATKANILYGIWTWDNCVITDNITSSNWYGIYVERDGSRVRGNATANDEENGITVDGADNAIEENFVTGSKIGIRFEKTGNFYTKNRASGNNTAYSGTSGNTNGGDNASF